MTSSNIHAFARYTIPSVLGMIGLSCYILADTFFISQGVGASGLTALNLAIPVYSLINGCGLMLGMGGATRYSIAKSGKDDSFCSRLFSATLGLAVIFSVLFVICGIFFSGQITFLMGADEEVFAMTKQYLQVILLFSPAFIFNNIFNAFVRNDNAPKLAMAAMLSGSIFNIIFDYILIFPLGLGMFGAVLATVFSPMVGMLILSVHGFQRKNSFHLQKFPVLQEKNFLPITGSILALGIPSLIAELSSGIVILVFNMIILSIQGNIGVAAYGVIANLSIVVVSVFTGIAQGSQPLLSRFYGKGDAHSIKCILRYALITMCVLSVFIYILFLFCADPITAAFNRENSALLQQIAVSGLKLYFLGTPFAGFNIILAVYFTSIDKPIPAQCISLGRGLVIIVPAAFLLSFLLKLTGVWLTFPAAEGIVALIGLLFYVKYR